MLEDREERKMEREIEESRWRRRGGWTEGMGEKKWREEVEERRNWREELRERRNWKEDVGEERGKSWREHIRGKKREGAFLRNPFKSRIIRGKVTSSKKKLNPKREEPLGTK